MTGVYIPLTPAEHAAIATAAALVGMTSAEWIRAQAIAAVADGLADRGA